MLNGYGIMDSKGQLVLLGKDEVVKEIKGWLMVSTEGKL